MSRSRDLSDIVNVALVPGDDILMTLPSVVVATTGATTTASGTISLVMDSAIVGRPAYWMTMGSLSFDAWVQGVDPDTVAFFNLVVSGVTLTITDSIAGVLTWLASGSATQDPVTGGVGIPGAWVGVDGGQGGPAISGSTATLSVPATNYRVATSAPVTIPATSFFVGGTNFTTANVSFTSTYMQFQSNPSLASGLPIAYNTTVVPGVVGYKVDGTTSEVSRNATTGLWQVDSSDLALWGRSVAVPNATVPAHSFIPIGSETNIDMVIGPKGSGALISRVPDNSNANGNKRGEYAIDLQLVAGEPSRVASGYGSVIVGGAGNTASADYSAVVGGGGNKATAQYSYAMGKSANTGAMAFSMAFGLTNGKQVIRQLLVCSTTNATPRPFLSTTYESTRTAINFTALPAGHSTYVFKILVIASGIIAGNATSGQSKAWEITGLIRRTLTAGSTAIVGTPTITAITGDGVTTGWAVAVTADTAFDGLALTATGAASTNITWNAEITLLKSEA